jgi:hypothetical protein
MRKRKIFDVERVVWDKRFVFKVCIDLANATLPPCRKRSRGRPPTYPGALYLATLLFKFYFNLAFRQAQKDLQLAKHEAARQLAKHEAVRQLVSRKVPWVQNPLVEP